MSTKPDTDYPWEKEMQVKHHSYPKREKTIFFLNDVLQV